MSNQQDDMILDQEEYNEAYKGLDLEEKLKNFYSQDSKSEEGFQKLKSSKTNFLCNKRRKLSVNTNIKQKKFSNTQINKIEKKDLVNKNNDKNFHVAKHVEKSENEDLIEEQKKKKNNIKIKKNIKAINNNNGKTEINYNNYNHENLLLDNNNIMEIENDENKENEKDEDLFEKLNEELIKGINNNNSNNNLEENPSEQSSLKKAKSTVILFIGCS
jgi:hypothetical protein